MPLLNSNSSTLRRLAGNKAQTPIRKTLLAIAIGCVPIVGSASPWLEANDAFLRSSLLLLSDSGQLASPVNHYPMRWSLFADDLNNTSQRDDVSIANRELSYALNSARLNRGNRLFKLLSGSNAAPSSGFGQFNEDQKGVYSSFEQLNNSYAFRLSAGYSEYQDDTKINWDDSYLALNSGAWLWSIGNLDRWWGQGWQHNLILGSYAKAAPDMSISYLGQNKTLGVWSAESLLSKPKESDVDYHSATRLVAKPLKYFEYGLTYQTWFADSTSNQSSSRDEQLALDAKLTLPSIEHFYHSVYAEAASTAKTTELGAWMLGWTGAFPWGENTVRIVLETQDSSSAHDDTSWSVGSYPSTTDKVANTTYTLDDSASVAVYLQLKNDHTLGVSHQRSTLDDEKISLSQLTYRLPALAGMVHLGASYEQHKGASNDNQATLWSGYEFRF
ncbi:capsule assembly Wzi family protein [Marinomonas sp. M1K-6]|uniref:Capsule assembly Wzi family protein n=2 Tax=Marinomonas profundi TaxID=2726122 RepID=A0A847R503_9GAMM|nr:capsule assembly Wzi family protein [Marinomonas profundi]UDV04831.1 hypothetical protein J8N69_05560 [Marinomonas profundi]